MSSQKKKKTTALGNKLVKTDKKNKCMESRDYLLNIRSPRQTPMMILRSKLLSYKCKYYALAQLRMGHI